MRRFTFDNGYVQSVFGQRFDANEVQLVARALRALEQTAYSTVYAAAMGRKIVPKDNLVPRGATSHSFKRVLEAGRAKVVDGRGADIPLVDFGIVETDGKIKVIADAFSVSWAEMEGARYSGVPIDTAGAQTARLVMEQELDDLIAVGNTSYGWEGLINHSDVGVVSSGFAGDWETDATAAEMLADLRLLADLPRQRSKNAFKPNLIALSDDHYAAAAIKPFGNDSGINVLDAFKASSSEHGVQAVVPWSKLNDAGAGGANRAMAGYFSPETVKFVLPVEFEMLAPQQKGLDLVTPCVMAYGGLKMIRPVAMVYTDSLV